MATREALVWRIETLVKDFRSAQQKVAKFAKEDRLSELDRQFLAKNYTDDVDRCWQRIKTTLEEYDRCPERFDHHSKLAGEFWNRSANSDFSSSVFIMTKFPTAGEPDADKLQAVIDRLQQVITARGYHPRIAQGATFKEWLWANVEAHLLFCQHGVAILEDRYRPELNPNVALEWGWMLGMGRKVIYLREKGFAKERADWSGRISYEFDWDQPADGIEAAIQLELPQR